MEKVPSKKYIYIYVSRINQLFWRSRRYSFSVGKKRFIIAAECYASQWYSSRLHHRCHVHFRIAAIQADFKQKKTKQIFLVFFFGACRE